MARTNRRREPDEVVNVNRSMKKKNRRNDRKNSKKRIQEIDHSDPYSALLKKRKHELSQLSLLEVIITFGLIFLIPIYITEYSLGFEITLNKPFILVLIYVVLFPGLAAFICWIKGISLIGPNRSGVFLHLMPILSAIMAMIIFKEKFMLYHLLGAFFILSGIILSNRKSTNA